MSDETDMIMHEQSVRCTCIEQSIKMNPFGNIHKVLADARLLARFALDIKSAEILELASHKEK